VYFGISTIGTIRGVIVLDGVEVEPGCWMCDPAGLCMDADGVGEGWYP
jgi:hypothetical protein